MDDMQRIALEKEFEEKSARLSEMMTRMDDMQAAYRQYEAASRASLVRPLYDALTAEEEEVARMQGHVDKAQEEQTSARRSGERALRDAAGEAVEAMRLSFDLAVQHRDSARQAYEAMLARQGFDSEAAFKAACLTRPAFLKLEETITPFRTEYAQLLKRCEEIEKLLSENE